MRDDFLPFSRPMISEDAIRRVGEVLRSGWIGTGRRTREFEDAFAEYVGAREAVAVSSCTAALHLALEASGVGPGDEVVTTPLTFAASVNAILYAGARPVLADVDPDTLNLDPDAVESAVGADTRAILPVHFGGLPCDLDALADLAEAHDLLIVEDAAHAAGARHGGRPVGGHGHLACFSFYPTKNLTTVEGGMVTTDDPELAVELRIRRLHGLSSDAWRRYEEDGKDDPVPLAVERGYKYNMTDVQAVLGIEQLSRLESFLSTRERLAALYDRELEGLPLERQPRPAPGHDARHALHLYVVLLEPGAGRPDRDAVVRALREENIGVQVHYPVIPRHPRFRRLLPYGPGDFPVAESVADRIMTLPLGPWMEEDDVRYVAGALRDALREVDREAVGSA